MPDLDSDLYDFFVSYARRDDVEGWVSGFVDELLLAHEKFTGGRKLTCFFDRKNIRTGDDWAQTLNDGIRRSRLFLAFISPEYFASEWCLREWRFWIDTEIAKHILTIGVSPVYLVEVPGLVGRESLDEQDVAEEIARLCNLPTPWDAFRRNASPVLRQLRKRQLLAEFAQPFQREGLKALWREDLRHVLEGLAADLGQRSRRVEEAANSESSIPPYNRKFSGRYEQLLELRSRLVDDRTGVICGIHGLGGIGKTELAYTYAHAFASAYPGGRFLIPCERQSDLRTAILKLDELETFRANVLDWERDNIDHYSAAIIRSLGIRLREKGHILLILDNVSDASLVSPEQTDRLTVLGPKLHLLATTRMPRPAGNGGWLTLGELNKDESLELLEKHRPFADESERDAAIHMVDQLGGFALALELVAAWLACHEGASYATLAKDLGLAKLERMGESEDVELRRHNHERRLGMVLKPVFENMNPIHLRIMEYAALLPPDSIPEPWLRAMVKEDFPDEVQPNDLVADPWKDLFQHLMRLALLNPSEASEDLPVVRIHRLVSEFIRTTFLKGEHFPEKVKAHLFDRAKYVTQRRVWGSPGIESEIRIVTECAHQWLDQGDFTGVQVAGLVSTATLNRDGYAQTEALTMKALEQISGDNSSWSSLLLRNRSAVLREQKRFEESLRLLERAIAIDKSLEHSESALADDYDYVGMLHHAQGHYAEAESSYAEAVRWVEKAEPNAEATELLAVIEHNQADLLTSTGRAAESVEKLRSSVALFEKVLGTNHSHVAAAHNTLAVAFHSLGDARSAEEHYRNALTIYQKIYREDHLKVAGLAGHLALSLLDQGRALEARPLLRHSIEVMVEVEREGLFIPHFLSAAREAYATALLQSGLRRSEIERLLGAFDWRGRISLFRMWRQRNWWRWLRHRFGGRENCSGSN